jgi:hypothetical protein
MSAIRAKAEGVKCRHYWTMIRPRSVTYLPLLALLLAPLPAMARQGGAAPSAVEDLDQKAKRLFVAGKYAEAIDILARLYTDTGNPIYLRNIARCYQRLRDADRAIASFEEYLLRAKDVSKAEREEIRGFIRDLEDLKRRNAEAARSAPGNDVRPPAPVPPAPAPASATTPANPPAAPAIGQPPAVTPGASSAPRSPGSLPASAAQPEAMPTTFSAAPPEADVSASARRPMAGKLAIAGMAAGGALLLGGGIMNAAAWAKYRSADKDCPGFYYCEREAATVDKRSRLSKILLLSGLAVGLASGTVFLLNPARPSELALGLGGRF